MDRRIVGFHQDAELEWVAELECGHNQHVRHDPPWQERPWVLSPASRAGRLGTVLPCRLCDAAGAGPGLPDPYTDARLRGLCHDGALEASRVRPEAPKPDPNR